MKFIVMNYNENDNDQILNQGNFENLARLSMKYFFRRNWNKTI